MKYNKEEEFKIVKFLRFRLDNPQTARRTYMPYTNIAKYLNKSVSYIHNICSKLARADNHVDSTSQFSFIRKSYFSRFITKKGQHFTEEQV